MTSTLFLSVCGSSSRLVDYAVICKVVITYRLTLNHKSQLGYTDVFLLNLPFSMNITSQSGVSGNFL